MVDNVNALPANVRDNVSFKGGFESGGVLCDPSLLEFLVRQFNRLCEGRDLSPLPVALCDRVKAGMSNLAQCPRLFAGLL